MSSSATSRRLQIMQNPLPSWTSPSQNDPFGKSLKCWKLLELVTSTFTLRIPPIPSICREAVKETPVEDTNNTSYLAGLVLGYAKIGPQFSGEYRLEIGLQLRSSQIIWLGATG